MQYRYTAVSGTNKKSHGTINAENKTDALARLQEQGLIALELLGGESKKDAARSVWQMEIGVSDIHKTKIKKKKLLAIMHQMSIMMKAGVSLSMAMEVLIESEKNKKHKAVLTEINSDLYTGTPISASMAKFQAFPEILVNIVQSGETNGRLDTAFERCAVILEKEIALTAKVKGAMGYPTFLLFLTLLLIIIMNALVLPNFELVFKQFGADLPALTVAVMNFSHFLTAYWFLILPAILLVVFGFYSLKKYNQPFSTAMDRFSLKVPAIGRLLRQSYISRFCRMMSSLVEAGVEIVRSLEISRNVIPNRYFRDQLSKVIADVKLGSSINASAARFPVFDPLLVSMLKVGEESGMLAETLDKMASLYEEQTEESTKRLTAMLEPSMTILIAVVVGTVVISIVLPMFRMYGVIAGK